MNGPNEEFSRRLSKCFKRKFLVYSECYKGPGTGTYCRSSVRHLPHSKRRQLHNHLLTVQYS
jgi:hypothetical protein